MKSLTTPPSSNHRKRGITLLELTVVIVVLLSLMVILFVGARSWKKGSDRATCIMNLRSAQMLVRGYQNTRVLPEDTSINMFTDILNPAGITPRCPGGGDYDHIGYIPPAGELVMWCSLSGSDSHMPAEHSEW